jgi:hypothetical protein
MAENARAFIERVLDVLPQLRAQYEVTTAECVAEGFGDGAPFIFLGEYTHTLLEAFRVDPAVGRSPLAKVALILEAEFGRDPEVDSIIDSAFVTLMGTKREPDPAVVLGPKLAGVLNRQRSWRAMPVDQALVECMIGAVPALEPLARDNTYGDHEDVLVHEFLADVVRQEVDNFLSGSLAEVRAVLDLLEQEWGGDVDEPIAVSFVENLPYPHEPAAALVDLLGPNLRAEHDRQRRPPAPPL